MMGRANSDASIGISVIVPLLNEEAVVPALIEQLDGLDVEQIIVVDGGSDDATRSLMLRAGYQVIQSPAGRAAQMNLGAKKATQAMLLFLHADTELPNDFKSEVGRAEVWGRFDVSFFGASKAMAVVAFFMNLRSRISGVATGDQALFVDREVFSSIGGFPDFAIMEDVALCKRLRRLHRPLSSFSKVKTSARRWETNGVLTTILKMWWYRLAYFFGVSPTKLKQRYDDVR